MRPLLRQGVLLLAGAVLLLSVDFALAAGATGMAVWAILSAADVAAFAALLLADFRARRDERVLASLTMLLALAFVLGEYGCSTDSSLSFLVSIWKVLAVLLFLAVLAMGRSCRLRGGPSPGRIQEGPVRDWAGGGHGRRHDAPDGAFFRV